MLVGLPHTLSFLFLPPDTVRDTPKVNSDNTILVAHGRITVGVIVRIASTNLHLPWNALQYLCRHIEHTSPVANRIINQFFHIQNLSIQQARMLRKQGLPTIFIIIYVRQRIPATFQHGMLQQIPKTCMTKPLLIHFFRIRLVRHVSPHNLSLQDIREKLSLPTCIYNPVRKCKDGDGE